MVMVGVIFADTDEKSPDECNSDFAVSRKTHKTHKTPNSHSFHVSGMPRGRRKKATDVFATTLLRTLLWNLLIC